MADARIQEPKQLVDVADAPCVVVIELEIMLNRNIREKHTGDFIRKHLIRRHDVCGTAWLIHA